MRVLGIDPAPAKDSVIFDGQEFQHFSPKQLKEHIDRLSMQEESLFIAWDAPLSAAMDEENFSLTIRKIERFFNRNGRYAKELHIPEGISTLGFSSCPHWTLSQYLFGYPVINPHFCRNIEFELVMDNEILQKSRAGHFLTEIHPALSMWILLKDIIDDELFDASWKYKGDSSKETKKRSHIIVEHLFALEFVQEYIDTISLRIITDDELDAFVCWLMGRALINNDPRVRIYGDRSNGSFLLPFDAEIYNKLNSYLYS